MDTARGVLRALETEQEGALALHLDGPAAVIHDAVRLFLKTNWLWDGERKDRREWARVSLFTLPCVEVKKKT